MKDDLKNKIKWKATSKKIMEDDLKRMEDNKKIKNGRRPQSQFKNQP